MKWASIVDPFFAHGGTFAAERRPQRGPVPRRPWSPSAGQDLRARRPTRETVDLGRLSCYFSFGRMSRTRRRQAATSCPPPHTPGWSFAGLGDKGRRNAAGPIGLEFGLICCIRPSIVRTMSKMATWSLQTFRSNATVGFIPSLHPHHEENDGQKSKSSRLELVASRSRAAISLISTSAGEDLMIFRILRLPLRKPEMAKAGVEARRPQSWDPPNGTKAESRGPRLSPGLMWLFGFQRE